MLSETYSSPVYYLCVPVLECVDGTYGYACVKNCSGHCQNESSCNKQTGYCDRGCNPGYSDNDCRLGVLQKFSKLLTANFKYAR